MRKKIELYLNGMRADIDTDTLILMNYKQIDTTSPSAVYNSFSQSIILPRSKSNDTIFAHIERADCYARVNPFYRNPFEVYSEEGEILESGYYKIDSVEELQYSVTLYGGLGGFLFGLMYNADGTKKTLADLDYGVNLGFTMSRDAVRDAWRELAGIHSNNRWNIINFVPCYNGLPQGEFDKQKAFAYKGVFGVETDKIVDNVRYKPKYGHVGIELQNEVDEWAAGDLRSYLQRPAIKVEAIIDALTQQDNNGGYSVSLDPVFFHNGNKYYKDSWMTLGMLSDITLENESGTATQSTAQSANWADAGYNVSDIRFSKIGSESKVSKGASARSDISVTFKPMVKHSSSTDLVMAREYPRTTGRRYERAVCAYQLVAYDTAGNPVGGSKVMMVTTRTRSTDGSVMEPVVSPAEFVRKFNSATPALKQFHPQWVEPESNESDMLESSMYSAIMVQPNGRLMTDGGTELSISVSVKNIIGVAYVRLYSEYLGIYTTSPNYYTQNSNSVLGTYDAPSTDVTINGLGHYSVALSYSYSISGNIRSGAQITQSVLLGNTLSPAEYLLSYCKMFGLHLTYDRSSKSISILTRNTFYGGQDYDITDIVAKDTIKIKPYAVENHWYDFVQKADGTFAEYYKKVYGVEYGLARYNTGWEFNNEYNDALKGNILKGACMSEHQNKYFLQVTEDGKECPAPFVDGGQYTLYSPTSEAKSFDITCPSDSATIVYTNPRYKGYDISPKPEFENNGNSIGGENVLLLFGGCETKSAYSRFCLTDDNGLMILYNGGKPCWLLGQSLIPSNENYCMTYDSSSKPNAVPYPLFSRWVDGFNLDMGVAYEYDIPDAIAEYSAVYGTSWERYITDLSSSNNRVMTCKVRLGMLGRMGQWLLRNFYWYDNVYWVLTSVKNYALGSDDLAECTFVKVIDKDNYTNGQLY